jgi:hypothetical protein
LFEKIQEIINEHFSVESEQRHYGWGENGKNGLSIVFHEKIGAHGIVVATTRDSTELVNWINNFLEDCNVTQNFSLGAFEPVIMNYVARGFRYYVVDIITVLQDPRSVEPILYWFETSFLYYPLVITTPLGGYTSIALFLLTEKDVRTVSPEYSPFYPKRLIPSSARLLCYRHPGFSRLKIVNI